MGGLAAAAGVDHGQRRAGAVDVGGLRQLQRVVDQAGLKRSAVAADLRGSGTSPIPAMRLGQPRRSTGMVTKTSLPIGELNRAHSSERTYLEEEASKIDKQVGNNDGIISIEEVDNFKAANPDYQQPRTLEALREEILDKANDSEFTKWFESVPERYLRLLLEAVLSNVGPKGGIFNNS